MKKIPRLYILLSVIAVAALIGVILVPETGSLTLLNEVFSILLMGIVTAMLIKALPAVFKAKKAFDILLVLSVVVVIGAVTCYKTFNTIRDFAAGPEQITVLNCDVDRQGGTKGIFSLNYYLQGEDSTGEKYRFKISASDYETLKGVDEVSVFCYKNTGRLVDFKKG